MPDSSKRWFVTTGWPPLMYVGLDGVQTPLMGGEAEARAYLADEVPVLLLRDGVIGESEFVQSIRKDWNFDGADVVYATTVEPRCGDVFVCISRGAGEYNMYEVEAVRGGIAALAADLLDDGASYDERDQT